MKHYSVFEINLFFSDRKRFCASLSKETLQKDESSHVAMSYICRLKPRSGTLNLEKCVEKGVPPGPMLGRLKSGDDVELEDGTIVMSQEVCDPDEPGAVFLGKCNQVFNQCCYIYKDMRK